MRGDETKYSRILHDEVPAFHPSTTRSTGWRGSPGRRLAVSSFLATILLVVAASTLRLPESSPPRPDMEVTVEWREWEPDPPVANPEPEPPPDIEPEPEQVAESAKPPPATEISELPEPAAPPVDWTALRDMVAADVAAEAALPEVSVNPVFDELRRQAAIKFRRSEAPEKRYIWDNVEKDQVGRTILVAGDCHRVLDDPSAVNRWVHETFTQYLVFCAGAGNVGRELPWVADVRANHTYLQEQEDRRNGVFND